MVEATIWDVLQRAEYFSRVHVFFSTEPVKVASSDGFWCKHRVESCAIRRLFGSCIIICGNVLSRGFYIYIMSL